MKTLKNNLIGIVTTVVMLSAIPAMIWIGVNSKPVVRPGYVKALNGNLYHKVK